MTLGEVVVQAISGLPARLGAARAGLIDSRFEAGTPHPDEIAFLTPAHPLAPR